VAEIVGAFGVPHTPVFPWFVQSGQGPAREIAERFAELTRHLEELRPDLIVMFDTDHLNTFFLDNWPIFAVGVGDAFGGPNDEPRGVPAYTVPSRGDFAAHLRRLGIDAGFDLALAQEFTVDHSIIVPLHFMTPTMQVPVVPVFVSGHIPPLPPARRCRALGRLVREAVETWPEPLRVVTMGSGSFSLDVWGPRIAPGRSDGVPDPAWVTRVVTLLERGDVETLVAEATEEKMLGAGNVGGEILNWIAMLGTFDARPATSIKPQMPNGHAYAVWRWS
jgi:aromatic ring-opening dioxygenase catalytic subunit (LigB family)